MHGNVLPDHHAHGSRSWSVRCLHGCRDTPIVTASGATVAVHRRAPNGAGATIRDDGHVRALETRVLAGFSDARPCRSKTRRPAGDASRAEAARLRGTPAAASSAERVVIDLSAYAALVPAAARGGAAGATTLIGGTEK